MKASQLRARYWRIVFFFGRVTLGFIFWEILLRRVGLGGWAARGRSERMFGTLQDRLPKELRLAGITTRQAANRFIAFAENGPEGRIEMDAPGGELPLSPGRRLSD